MQWLSMFIVPVNQLVWRKLVNLTIAKPGGSLTGFLSVLNQSHVV